MRDYFIIGIVLASLPVGLIRPFYGVLVYAWISYMQPHQLAWSFAQTVPLARLSALCVMAGTALSPPGDFSVLFRRETVAMLCLWGTYTVSTVFAFYPASAWVDFEFVSKMIVMALLTGLFLSDRQRVRLFLLVVAFSLGFYGLKGGLFALLTGGQYRVMGPGISMIGSENAIGLALNAVLPLLWYLAHEEQGWMKRALQATFFLTIPAVMFTYSRASILTLGVVLVAIALKSRKKVFLSAALGIVVIIGLVAAPQQWWDRVDTIQTYEEDASAMSRIDNWKFVWRLAMDQPFTGAGFEFFTFDTFARYAPEFLYTYDGTAWDTHSIYFAILGSHGFPGLLAFLTMIGFSLLSCTRMKRITRGYPDLNWIGNYSDAIQVSFLAFLVNGAFVNMEYFDLPYHWVAAVASMQIISRRELVARKTAAAGSTPDMSLDASMSLA